MLKIDSKTGGVILLISGVMCLVGSPLGTDNESIGFLILWGIIQVVMGYRFYTKGFF